MSRFLATAGLATAVLGLAVWAVTARPGPQEKTPTKRAKPPVAKKAPPAFRAASKTSGPEQHLQARDVYRLLDQRISIQFPPNTPIDDAFDALMERGHCPILIDQALFSADPDLKDQFPEGISKQTIISLPKLNNMRLGEILRLVINPVEGTFLVRDGALFIVPKKYVTSGEVLHQPVTVVFDREPLTMALERLADRTGVTLVMDPRLGANATVPVTATLSEVPVEAAVRVLANMSDLRVMRIGSMLYVTDSHNALAFGAELKHRRMPTASASTAKRSIAGAPAAR